MKCSFCGKEITDIKVSVEFIVGADRKRTDDTWENIPNMSLNTRENLCGECFSSFVEELSKKMKEDKLGRENV